MVGLRLKKLCRADIKSILSDPTLKRDLIVGAILFIQNMEGIDTTKKQAEAAYDKAIDKLEKVC